MLVDWISSNDDSGKCNQPKLKIMQFRPQNFEEEEQENETMIGLL